jgi:hypothetical protein
MAKRNANIWIAAAAAPWLVLAASGPARASVTVFNGDHVSVSAAAVFSQVPVAVTADFVTAGNVLTITLTNTSSDPTHAYVDRRSTTLTGLLFDFGLNDLVLAPVSATVAPGALINGANCSPGPCGPNTTNVGGEFAFMPGLAALGRDNYGISSTIQNAQIGFTMPSFNGPNLDNPANVDGINFGIVQSDGFDPDSGDGVFSNEPMIRGGVTFVLDGVAGHHAVELGGVTFLYGTVPSNSLQEDCVATCFNLEADAPEPPGLGAIAVAATAGLALRARRRRGK